MRLKIFAIISALFLLCACFIACDSGDTPAPTPDSGNNEPEKIQYTITWKDENGTTLSSVKVDENTVPTVHAYEKADTAEWDYTVDGWSATQGGEILSAIPAATADTTYYAVVSQVKQKYTVTFYSNGGTAVASQTVEYGNTVPKPDEPTYEGHAFIGWFFDENGTTAVDFNAPITANLQCYAFWNQVIDAKALLSALLSGYDMGPSSYIPESMRYDFSANLVQPNKIISDYSGFVNVSDICYGYGEQWHMVMDNIKETNLFFGILSVVDTLSATSIGAFNNYFDSNPADTAHHAFESGIYHVTIHFDGKIISYVLDYTAEISALGEQTVQIAMSLDSETGERVVRIQIGDANALSYKMLENSYEFAIKYLGVRRAYFFIERDEEGVVSGKIYEYLTVSSVEVASAAEFYITEEYVSVVGNKADGMTGFTGYINELYNAETGKLIGYEVQETLSKITYNTLWFNLDDIGGITSIRYQPAEGENPAVIYVNGKTKAWEIKTVGGLGTKMFSRRFDIEFKTQYVYAYDAEAGKYVEYKIQVPMMFVQEENYDTFIDDVKSTNSVQITVKVQQTDLEKILADYDELIPAFIENKDKITVDVIIAFIGDKITF